MNLFGAWIYGALTFILLYITGLKYDNYGVVLYTIFGCGAAYVAEHLNVYMAQEDDYSLLKLQWLTVAVSFLSGVIAFGYLLF